MTKQKVKRPKVTKPDIVYEAMVKEILRKGLTINNPEPILKA